MPEEMVVIITIIFGGAFSVAIVAIIAEAIRKTVQSRAKEESRREIAAYVAEGSISPDDAVRLLQAEHSAWKNMKDMLSGK
jgi:hypothetical protein